MDKKTNSKFSKINDKKTIEAATMGINAIEEEKDSKLAKDISEKLCRVKVNYQMRKSLAKKLSIDEKRALEWKIIADVFGCIDTATLAREHPKDCAKIVKTIASIVGIFFPVFLVVDAFPASTCAKIVEYAGTFTPEHLIHTKAQEMADSKQLELDHVENCIENGEDAVEAEVIKDEDL